jgi:hypothetical protein
MFMIPFKMKSLTIEEQNFILNKNILINFYLKLSFQNQRIFFKLI